MCYSYSQSFATAFLSSGPKGFTPQNPLMNASVVDGIVSTQRIAASSLHGRKRGACSDVTSWNHTDALLTPHVSGQQGAPGVDHSPHSGARDSGGTSHHEAAGRDIHGFSLHGKIPVGAPKP